ncbi:MAG: Asp-tRNA(Asn)/Glu-tRNA(Gln) amidotransferase subunit GatA [Eubacteriaceae bacterium]|nr:Asp-tRNA(Asn)/Glu-tRNA(Gln) amidotransferase subunit GatA [Eubacteriaceae bacterium]
MRICDMPLFQLSDMLRDKEISASELAADVLKRREEVGTDVGGYITVLQEKEILENAQKADDRIAAGNRKGKIDGIPYALKDNVCTKGILTTCSSKLLKNFVPVYNATVYEHLLNAGAVLVGKADMDEFAMGSANENSALSYTRNPWDTKKVAGGSSGGSSAVVASGQAVFSLGSDTGGSIRLPASFCGITGFKPTYSAVSRYGVMAFASSLDQVGPLTKDIRDTAIVLDEIVKQDVKDSTSAKIKTNYADNLNENIQGMHIGVDATLIEASDEDTKKAVLAAIEKLKELGCTIIDLSFNHNEIMVAVYYIISSAEASSNLARFDGINYGVRIEGENIIDTYVKTRSWGFGEEVKRRIMIGTFVLSSGYYDAYYKKALQDRSLIKNNFDKAFETCDCILSPTTIFTAYDAGIKLEHPTDAYLSDVFTPAANIAGLPAASIPCGFAKNGMPIGLQLMANSYQEQTLLNIAYAYQQNTDFHLQRPKLTKGGSQHEV